MATKLAEMIELQAQAIESLARLDVSQAVGQLRGARRIHVVGTGTSQHAAELAEYMFAGTGLDVRASSAQHFTRDIAWAASDEALIVISHTTQTAFAARARAEALAEGLPVVSITGPTGEWPEALRTTVKEESETYTVSYLAALTVLACIARGLGSSGLEVDDLLRAAAAVRAKVAEPGITSIEPPDRALAIVGAGPWSITAREGALKLREASSTLAEGFDSERLLHGFQVPYDKRDALVLLEPRADVDGLTAALGRAAAAEGITVYELEQDVAGLSPVLAQLPATVSFQLLADKFAAERGQDPDQAIRGAWAEEALWLAGAPADAAP